MIFHVVSLPHTNTTSDFVVCAYTEKVRKFCNMMKSLGHTVYLYGGTVTEAQCDELITCISEEDRLAMVGDHHYVDTPLDYHSAPWVQFNDFAIEGIRQRANPHDFICLIGGLIQKQIADALPEMMSVEIGIGYGGTFAKYRIFESYAWMHTCYAQTMMNVHDIDGRPFDAVIPNYFEVDKFPFQAHKEDYFLFMGRFTPRKGYQIAAEVCEHLGERLLTAGPGIPPTYGEYQGVVGEEARAKLMGGARAIFVPTIYVEPFGGVAIEAMLCGTPVISTDWGAFTETNQHGFTGYRCRTMGEFIWAAQNVDTLNPAAIRTHAKLNYSTERVAKQYQHYFEQLETLWEEGWYDKTRKRPDRTRQSLQVIRA